jgi:hypothetical protein
VDINVAIRECHVGPEGSTVRRTFIASRTDRPEMGW